MKEIYINDDIYPNMLKKIKNPPKKLFVDGNLDNLNSNCISVVGSRECTEYGKRWCESFIKKLNYQKDGFCRKAKAFHLILCILHFLY